VTATRKRKAFRNNREARLRWSRNANAAKARKRMAGPPPDREPRFTPCHRLKIIVVDTLTGERGEFIMRSVRDATRRLATLQRYYL